MSRYVQVLGTGGTIAGAAAPGAAENVYTAGQVDIGQLLAPVLANMSSSVPLVRARQVMQVDSRDMTHALWQALAQDIRQSLSDPEVKGIVVTHGTDTLEETAVFLDGVLRSTKPVVLTAAMRPATSDQADGPAHLEQALHLVGDPQASAGLWMVFGGHAWPATAVRKLHPFALDAFTGADEPVAARWIDGHWQWINPVGSGGLRAPWRDEVVALPDRCEDWPVVEIISSHAGASGRMVRAALDAGAHGIVVATTGNGSVHADIDAALHAAVGAGRLQPDHVLLASRCIGSWVVGQPSQGWACAPRLTPAQARVRLMLDIVAGG